MIYFDNSATTRKKPKSVISQVVNGLTNYSANPGRSGHKASINCAIAVNEVRENICEFFEATSPENIIFTLNCTDALNLAILGSIKKGGHVITTAFEHNSVLRPLHELKNKGLIELSIVEPKNKNIITASDIEPLIKDNTYMVVTVHISNVDGAITDIKEIGKLCKQKNILYLVDGAQSAGHEKISLKNDNISMLALAGHKGLFGPQGVGVLVLNDNVNLSPIRFGGTGTDSIKLLQPSDRPECYESGTIAVPNILGLDAGLNFVKKNFEIIQSKVAFLSKTLIYELKKINCIKLYTSEENLFGVIAFNISNIDSSIVSEFLNDKYSICVRSGLHCAPLKHKYLSTIEQGIVRVSLSYFNTVDEIYTLIYALKDFVKSFDIC